MVRRCLAEQGTRKMIKDGRKKSGLEGKIWAQIGLMVDFNWASREDLRKRPNTLTEYTKGKIYARKQVIKWLREDLADV